jgi:hypothetical protein
MATIGQESLHCFRNFYEPQTVQRIRVIIESSNSTILTAPELVEQVGFARLLVSDSHRQSADPLISFGTALLIINEIAANSATEPVTANLSGSLRNILRAAGNERMLAYRYLKFREWSHSKTAQCSKNYINIDAIFESSSGISLDDFFAAARLYAGLADRMDIEVNLEAVMPLFHTDWVKLSDAKPLRQFLRKFSWSRPALREFLGTILLKFPCVAGLSHYSNARLSSLIALIHIFRQENFLNTQCTVRHIFKSSTRCVTTTNYAIRQVDFLENFSSSMSANYSTWWHDTTDLNYLLLRHTPRE